MIFPRQVVEHEGGCKNFIPVNRGGSSRAKPRQVCDYNSVSFQGERWAAHRLSYCLNVSEIVRKPASRKEGLVLHKCDNKWCINPEHLYLGSASQNASDNADRNSSWRQKRSSIQRCIGFPAVSEQGRKSMAKKNAVRMKQEWRENKERMMKRRGL